MLHAISRPWLLGGVWVAAASVIVVSGVTMGAGLGTSALLLALCAVPAWIVLKLGLGAASPTVAELLYAVNNPKDGR